MSSVTVIIPVYNSMRTLKRCIDSILNQTFPVQEILVVDNGSTDDTRAYMSEFSSIVEYFDFGPGAMHPFKKNNAAQRAKGEYLFFIDSDMFLEPGVVEECLQEMMSGCVSVVVPERSIGIGFWAQCKRLERDCYHNDPLVETSRFMKRVDFLGIGGYDEKMIAGEDMDLHNKLLLIGTSSRTRSIILHDEGHLKLLKTVRKKGYYGGTFEPYRQKYPELAKRQFGWRRLGAFARNYKKLLRHPILTIGMFIMKFSEVVAFKMADRRTKE